MTKTKLWSLLALVVGVFAMAVVAGCGSSDDTSSDGTASDGTVATADLPLLKPGTLTVGSDIPYPPFEQGDPPDYEGFDIDLINAIADKMGLETSIQDKPFNLLLSGGGGQFDMAIAATTITAERAKKVDFTDPYYNASQGLLVPSGSDIKTGRRPRREDRRRPGRHDGRDVRQRQHGRGRGAAVPADRRRIQRAQDRPGRRGAQRPDRGPGRGEAARRARGRAGHPDRRAVRDRTRRRARRSSTPLNEALQQVKDDGTLTDLYQQYFKTDPPDALLQPGPAAALGGGDTTTGG